MPRLESQKDLQPLQQLPFCYVCGVPFKAQERFNMDHVPAKACFAVEDRNYPLQLPTHETCNCDHNIVDELVGQLVGLKRGAVPEAARRRLGVRTLRDERGRRLGGVNNLQIRELIYRWIGACHAALYREPLLPGQQFGMETPLPEGSIEDGRLRYAPFKAEQHAAFVEILKHHRAWDTLDSIRTNNGNFVYQCVWIEKFDDAWVCVFAMDLYGWADLGDGKNFQRRGCAGFYRLPGGIIPPSATKAQETGERVPNLDLFDPFGE